MCRFTEWARRQWGQPAAWTAPAVEPPRCACAVDHGPEHDRQCVDCGAHEISMAFWRGQWWCMAHFPPLRERVTEATHAAR